MLNMIEHGHASDTPGVLIAHGLFGSARNWGVIARRLSDSRHVVAVDMRNHASSPWFETHGYDDMAGDLAGVIAHLGGAWDVLGHSMGGKAAMMLALTRPDLVNRLIVADVAPVAYTHSQIQYIEAMKSVDLRAVERRADAVRNCWSGSTTPIWCRSFCNRSTSNTGAGCSTLTRWRARCRKSSAFRMFPAGTRAARCF
jgi:pimeloyl-ACP methyl ester carboxylesterase